MSTEQYDIVERLADGIRRRVGIQVTAELLAKLRRMVADPSDAALTRLVDAVRFHTATPRDWNALVERVTVHETYFYRDGAQFERIRAQILAPLVDRERERDSPSIRIWSAGTSTGEEAYTLAMLTLLELMRAGQTRADDRLEPVADPRWTVEILGTDVSRRVLEVARRARYDRSGGLCSDRGMPEELTRFFEPCRDDAGWAHGSRAPHTQVRACVRRLTRFEPHNLMSGVAPSLGFDLIVCRNVLIYFDADDKREVQILLDRALSPDGYLVLGPPDANMLLDRFEAKHSRDSVFYVKRGPEPRRSGSGRR